MAATNQPEGALGRMTRLLLRITLMGMAVALVVGLTSAPATAQDDGLIASSSTTYTPEPDQGEIEVDASYTLTNVTPDETGADGRVQFFYFETWAVTVPTTALDFTAVSSGLALDTVFETVEENEHVTLAVIDLPFDLQYQETVRIDVSYTIPGSQPRGDLFEARVNDSYLSFPIWTLGDSGETDVSVVIPAGFVVEVQGGQDELALTTDANGQRLLEATDLASPRDFYAHIFGRNDAGLLVETVTIDDANATIRAWPDDPEWVDFVIETVEEDVPLMEELIGLEWPAGDIEIIESVTPYLRGYGGWFDAQAKEIEVGPELNSAPILHELSHAWFNTGLIQDRWIIEGLAEEYASQTIAASGGDRSAPERPDLDDPVRVPLNSWASPFAFEAEAAFSYEAYHYNAAWWVIRGLTDEIGAEAMADVLVALDGGVSAFAREPTAEADLSGATWKQFLDLVERRAGSASATALLQTYVLADADMAILDERSQAHDAYDAFVERARPWVAPELLRDRLAQWSFESALRVVHTADAVIETRNEVDRLALELQVTFADSRGRSRFETATSERNLDTASQVLGDRLLDLEQLAQSRSATQLAADALGVSVSFAPGEFTGALRAVDELDRQLGALESARLEAEATARGAGLAMPPWPESAEMVDFEAEHGLIEERLDTIAAIAGADEAVASSRSVSEQVGLWRTDVAPHVAEARSAFEADDRAGALDASAKARTLIADASSIGNTRILWTAIAAGVLVIAATGLFAARRRT